MCCNTTQSTTKYKGPLKRPSLVTNNKVIKIASMLVTFPHNIMLSRTSGDECAMLIRKRSSASNSSMRSCSSAASSSCVSMNTVSSFDSNDGGIVNTAANSIIHPMLQHGYHQQPQQPIVNMNNNIVTGADSTLLSTVTSVNAPINYYYTSSSSSCRINIVS